MTACGMVCYSRRLTLTVFVIFATRVAPLIRAEGVTSDPSFN